MQSDRNSQHDRKKAGQAELARKLDANVRVTKFRVLFAAFRARVQTLKRRLLNKALLYKRSLTLIKIINFVQKNSRWRCPTQAHIIIFRLYQHDKQSFCKAHINVTDSESTKVISHNTKGCNCSFDEEKTGPVSIILAYHLERGGKS